MGDQQESGTEKSHTLTKGLYVVFSRLVEAGQPIPNQATPIVRDAWSRALGTPDERTLWRAFDTLSGAIDRIEASIPRLPNVDSQKVMGDLIAAMRAWMEMKSLSGPCSSLIPRTQAVLPCLHFAEASINSAARELDISSDALSTVVERLSELEAAVMDESIPPYLRAMLHQLVARMKWAVRNYQIVGVQGLVREVTEAQMALIEIARLSGDMGPTEQPGWFRKSRIALSEMSKKISEALTLVKAGHDTIELGQVLHLLPKL